MRNNPLVSLKKKKKLKKIKNSTEFFRATQLINAAVDSKKDIIATLFLRYVYTCAGRCVGVTPPIRERRVT